MSIINIGNLALDTRDVAIKLQTDILFLEARLRLLHMQANPNPQVIETYARMLECRQAVLGWINQHTHPIAQGKLG